MGVRNPARSFGWIGEFRPVELGLFAGWMRDHREVGAGRGSWVPAGVLGSIRHGVLLAVVGGQLARQVGVRERLAGAEGRFDVCLDGGLLTVVRSAAVPPPCWQDLEEVLLSSE